MSEDGIQQVGIISLLPPEDRRLGAMAAARAVERMLLPGEEGIPQARSLCMTAAEALCAPLLPYLAPDELRRLRDAMTARTPRRLMFPKQVELLDAMERRLEETAP